MDLGLQDKVALVTGSSRGIGKACASALAAEGVRLAMCARGRETLRRAAKEIREATGAQVLDIAADLTNHDDIKNLVNKTLQSFGSIDILVTNAGGPPTGEFMELSDKQWREAVSLTLLSVTRLCREIIPHMRKNRWGRIVHLTSVSTRHVLDNLVLSNSLRLAVIGLSKTLAFELGGSNITVNTVCQGRTATERLKKLIEDAAMREGVGEKQIESRWASDIALGRLATPDEIANVVVFLASEKASYVNGAAIPVDGGFSRMPL